jgi:hypothetical protein
VMWDQIERKSRRIEAWRLSVGIACLPLYSLHHLDSWVMDRGKEAKIDFFGFSRNRLSFTYLLFGGVDKIQNTLHVTPFSDMDHHHHEDQLQLQIPHFVYNSTPTLIPGGGAEVIPIASAPWFASNNGFTIQDECVVSSLMEIYR